jgi:hypothetical protein
VPTNTLPELCADPNPDPLIVICAPAEAAAGEIPDKTGGAGGPGTVMVLLALADPAVAVTVTVPGCNARARIPPAGVPAIETTEESEEFQEAELLKSWVVPSENVAVAVSHCRNEWKIRSRQ